MMKFKILGSLEVATETNTFRPSSPKVCQVLALLLGNPNQVVSTDNIIEELWGENPPRSVATTVQTYIYQLRRALGQKFPDADLARCLVTQSPGYRLDVCIDDVDAAVFERLVIEGRRLTTTGEIVEARERFERALALWAGNALANVPQERRLSSLAVRLEERRIEAIQLKISAEMQLGMHAELISELRTCTEYYPLNEWFVGQLMCALSRSGRRAEALEAFQWMRQTLDSELGMEPSAELSRLQVAVLRGDESFGGGQTTPAGVDDSPAFAGDARSPERSGVLH
ncbi:AfsR/SARP family transcriptional regulator [Salinifilum ghardaiensis]